MHDNDYFKIRTTNAAIYIIENRSTIRKAAEKLGVSKSTVHKDLCERLPHYNYKLSMQVREILDINRQERHIRGGLATRDKYKSVAEIEKNKKLGSKTSKNPLK